MAPQYKFMLDDSQIPRQWYNIAADLQNPPSPPMHPGTGQPIGPDDLAPLFPMAIIGQEVSPERWIDIPEPVQDAYATYRATPLYRAHRLEQALGTPAHIYYKYEGASPVGSHKANTAIAQAFYNREEGVKRIATETGAGQWGSALAWACQMFGIELKVYMVKVSFEQKPYRKAMMNVFGAEVIASPSDTTEAGRNILASDPDTTGSLGIAISEAVEDAASRDDTRYSLGSVLNHVLMHQTVIGQEAMLQMEMAGEEPDVVIGCVGGGSNYAGLAFPFMRARLAEGAGTRFVATEPTSCPTLTQGTYAYDFGDVAGMTPLVKMATLGHTFVPPAIHAGGLRYHGMAPLISQLHSEGHIEAVAHPQRAVFDGAVQFARAEGIIPAPESSHAVRSAIDEALQAKDAGEERVILFNLSGHGLLDLGAYEQYFAGELEDHEYPVEQIAEALKLVPEVAAP
ncbi:MAG: TrpB-like pyridoxal phosphate-dependent enzyme [Dehalococcoidia bacterium]|jgi:tryptophan synthase beta chain|nr:TrpB-like pyridoxal phosphate-dependent enzyme [Dehalococcoidia bacterium]